MLNKTFFTDIEHKDKYFRNFINDVIARYPLGEKDSQERYIFQFPLNWHDRVHDRVNYSNLGF